MSYLRIIGLISLIGWMICIMVIWIYANIRGFVYFQGGEPLWWIKYPEWILGVIGITTAIQYLILELNKKNNHAM